MTAVTHRTTTGLPDVAIIGGGVAGSALAISLRRRGFDVALIERQAEFRDRIRGEAIHPWGANEVRKLGLYDLILDQAKAQPQFLWQTYREREAQTPYRWADDFPDIPNGLGVSHVALQDALIAEATCQGVAVYRPAAVTFTRANQNPVLTITTDQREVTVKPRMVVGADGEHSATRQWMGGSITFDPVHHHLGGVLIRGLGLDTDRIHQAFLEGGFVFVSPQANDLARLYLVCSTSEAQTAQRTENPAAHIVRRFLESVPEDHARSWEHVGPAGFFPNATAVATIPSSRDTVLIGDASGRNDPSQGHGLSLVFHDVRILCDLIDAEMDWTEIPDQFHQTKSGYFEVLRQHAHWNERQATETGPEIEALRNRIARSRELDPTAGGFAAIFATGPDGLLATEDARRHYLGEDLIDVLASRDS